MMKKIFIFLLEQEIYCQERFQKVNQTTDFLLFFSSNRIIYF